MQTESDAPVESTHGWPLQRYVDVNPHPIQWCIRRLGDVVLRAIWRQRHINRERVPEEGAVLICPNHTHFIDFCPQAMGFRRDIRVFAKSEILRIPVLGAILRQGGVFPVVRGGGDQAAITLAERILASGQLLILFPEGTRCRKAGEWGRPRSGAARLALASGCTVVPSATYGLQPGTGREHLPRGLKWLPFNRRLTTVYGEPLVVPVEPGASRERVEEVRDQIWERIVASFLRAQADQLARAGREPVAAI